MFWWFEHRPKYSPWQKLVINNQFQRPQFILWKIYLQKIMKITHFCMKEWFCIHTVKVIGCETGSNIVKLISYHSDINIDWSALNFTSCLVCLHVNCQQLDVMLLSAVVKLDVVASREKSENDAPFTLGRGWVSEACILTSVAVYMKCRSHCKNILILHPPDGIQGMHPLITTECQCCKQARSQDQWEGGVQ